MASDILIVDDEVDIRELVAGILSDEGHETRIAHDATAPGGDRRRVPRLIFLDIWLQGSGSTAWRCSTRSRSCIPTCRL